MPSPGPCRWRCGRNPQPSVLCPVLEQNHRGEVHAVVCAATGPDRVFVLRSEPGCGFAGLEDLDAEVGDGGNELAGERSDAGYALQEVQCGPFAGDEASGPDR